MLHEIRNRFRFRQLAKNMNMVGDAADDNGWALAVFQYRRQIGVCVLLQIFGRQQRFSIFRRENEVGKKVGQGL